MLIHSGKELGGFALSIAISRNSLIWGGGRQHGLGEKAEGRMDRASE